MMVIRGRIYRWYTGYRGLQGQRWQDNSLEKRQSSHNFRTIWYSSELENLFLWSFNHIQLLVKLVIMATARGAGTVFALELQFLFCFLHYVEFGSVQVCTSVACTAVTIVTVYQVGCLFAKCALLVLSKGFVLVHLYSLSVPIYTRISPVRVTNAVIYYTNSRVTTYSAVSVGDATIDNTTRGDFYGR
uniref:Uncharacterized protein n=1 Tax=Cacopsylla melanoneura TaxID=428564 RepID=A0A8D9BQ09_9HEMI